MTPKNSSELLAEAQRLLGGSESRREAELLLTHTLQRPRAWLYAHADEAVDEATEKRFRASLARRAGGEPVAYITGRREFWSLDLAVGAEVLIPRPETELLVEQALLHIPQSAEMDIADLGTGSGAVALAIARERPLARVLATDASAPALRIARANAQSLGIGNIAFSEGDWCAALGDRRFSLIVSNPPYIAADDMHMAQGDLRFEPRAALTSGADGLEAIRAILRDAPSHLTAEGWLLFEHGQDQGAACRQLLARSGLVEVTTVRDLEGRERVTCARAGAPSP